MPVGISILPCVGVSVPLGFSDLFPVRDYSLEWEKARVYGDALNQ